MVFKWAAKSVFLLTIFLCCGMRAIGADAALPWNNPSAWKSDGGWQIATGADNILTLTANDELRHNKIALLKIDSAVYQGYTLNIRCRLSPKNSIVEIALGLADEKEISELSSKSDYPAKIAESWSLNGLNFLGTQEWLNFSATITTDKKINTIAIVGFGLETNMKLEISDMTLTRGEKTWFTWPVSKKINQRKVERSPAQDYFPFGFYLPCDTLGNYMKATGTEDRSEAIEKIVMDIAARGCNYIYFINFGYEDFELFYKLSKKYGIKYTADFGPLNPKFNDWEYAFRGAMNYIRQNVNNEHMLTWAFGEEYTMDKVDNLRLFHEVTHAIDPKKTVSIIHHMNKAAAVSFNRDDVRVAFRDAYPFYKLAQCGPVSYPAQINYYENELNTMWQNIPIGASVWSMPQACSDYWSTEQGIKPYLQIENREQIRIQAWAALGMGCSGIVYFYYGVPWNLDGPPLANRPDGVLDAKGRATFMLDEITELAAKLVPVGPIIARLEKTNMDLSSNHPELRAYLFRHIDDHKGYIIAYNRSITTEISGQIKVPFSIGASVYDIVNKKYLATENSALIPLQLRAGDGAIIFLDKLVPMPETTN